MPQRLVHLRKLRSAVRRRAFERRLGRVPVESYEPLVHLGTEYGGWVVPDDVIDETWTCYCVGAGSDTSFDMELIGRYGARVRAFDPFPLLGEIALAEADGDPRFSFHAVAIAAQDGSIEMVGRPDAEHGSVSAAGLFDSGETFTRPARTVPSLMQELGDPAVDLLKLDVEGIEYDVVPSLDLRALGVRVFLVELHHTRSAATARRLIDALAADGYALVHRKHPTNFTFVRRVPA